MPYSYLGCFRDNSKKRLLTNYYKKLSNNSPTRCVDLCLQSGYLYAGVEYGKECFCGKTLSAEEYKLNNNSCNMECPQNPLEKCGGYFSINIYNTGLPSELLFEFFILFYFLLFSIKKLINYFFSSIMFILLII